jgi:hypothetical protein
MTRLQAFSSSEDERSPIFPLKGYVEKETMGLHLRGVFGLKFGADHAWDPSASVSSISSQTMWPIMI